MPTLQQKRALTLAAVLVAATTVTLLSTDGRAPWASDAGVRAANGELHERVVDGPIGDSGPAPEARSLDAAGLETVARRASREAASDPAGVPTSEVRVAVDLRGRGDLPMPLDLGEVELRFELPGRSESLSLMPGSSGALEIDGACTGRVTLSGSNYIYRQFDVELLADGVLEVEAELSAAFTGRLDFGGAAVPPSIAYRYDFQRALPDHGDLVYESSGRRVELADDGRFLLLGEQGAGTYTFHLDGIELEGGGAALGGFVPEGTSIDLGAWAVRPAQERTIGLSAQLAGAAPPAGTRVRLSGLTAMPSGLARFGDEIDFQRTREARLVGRATTVVLDAAGRGEATVPDAPFYLAVATAPGLPPVHVAFPREALGSAPLVVDFAPGREVHIEVLTDNWMRARAANVRIEVLGAGVPAQVPIELAGDTSVAAITLPASALVDFACVADWRREGQGLRSERLAERAVAIDTSSDLPQVVQLDLRAGPRDGALTIPIRLPGGEFEAGLAAIHPEGGTGGLRRVPFLEGTVTVPLGTGPTTVSLFAHADGHSRVAHTHFTVDDALSASRPVADLSTLSLVGVADPSLGDGYVVVTPLEDVRGVPAVQRGVSCFPAEDGRFEVYGLPPGRYEVRIAGSGQAVEVALDREAPRRVQLGAQ